MLLADPHCHGANIPASTNPPGGLAPSNTPLIVLLTFDDTITSNSYALVQGILTNHSNPNGSPIKATFFISLDGRIDYALVNKLYAAGHEVAVHTMTHSNTTNTDLATWRREIAGCRKTLADLAAIPLDQIAGFRAPYLKFNDHAFQILAEQGFVYDSSLLEWPGSYSTNASRYLWPYTLDSGIVQSNRTGAFPITPVPGLFEMPIWSMVTSGVSAIAMEPPDIMSSNEVTSIWKTNFLLHYEGNRAPFGLYIHATAADQWLSNTNYTWRSAHLNAFIDWLETYSNVWFLTMRDATEFMRTPVSADQASTSTLFQTRFSDPFPANQISFCRYNSGNFFACGSCPPVYPAPTTLYTAPSTLTGGVLSITVNTNAFNTEFHLSYSNDTAETTVDWEAIFEFPTNLAFHSAVEGAASLETNGAVVRLTITPAWYLRALASGQAATAVYFAMRGVVSTNVTLVSSRLLNLAPLKPVIRRFLRRESGALDLSWTESAYGYSIHYSSNLWDNSWQTVSTVYGSTNWTWTAPTTVPNGFLRINGLP